MTHRLVVFLLLLPGITLIPIIDVTAGKQTYYSAVPGSDVGLQSPVKTWPDSTSQLGCAARCSVVEPRCLAFIWDSSTGECTTGSIVTKDVNSTLPVVNGATKLLYVAGGEGMMTMKPCRYDLGYELRVSPYGRVRCVYFSREDRASYHDAAGNCSSHGGRLLKTNYRVLIDWVVEVAFEKGFEIKTGNGYIYVGLDDIETEDSFVWSDGTPMLADERSTLFWSGNPDNFGPGGEDCVVIFVPFKMLDDVVCRHVMTYWCEMGYYYK